MAEAAEAAAMVARTGAVSVSTSATSPRAYCSACAAGEPRTLPPGRRQTNLLASRKREHSRKPDELYPIIEACSGGPFLELFARGSRLGWTSWGREVEPLLAADRGGVRT